MRREYMNGREKIGRVEIIEKIDVSDRTGLQFHMTTSPKRARRVVGMMIIRGLWPRFRS